MARPLLNARTGQVLADETTHLSERVTASDDYHGHVRSQYLRTLWKKWKNPLLPLSSPVRAVSRKFSDICEQISEIFIF